MKKLILGISAFYHDSSAVLLQDGVIIGALQEERFSRVKQDKRFPEKAIKKLLEINSIKLADIDAVYYYENPELKFNRIMSSYFHYPKTNVSSFLSSVPDWILNKRDMRKILIENFSIHFKHKLPTEKIHFSDHHLSHAASAFFPSPFSDAAVLCIDGVGEWATTSVWLGKDNTLSPLWEIRFPHSIGLLYSAFTFYCGFKVDSGEYKLMGLAPYGEARYTREIYDNLLDLKSDGTFRLNMAYFNYVVGNSMITEKLEALFDQPARKPESQITQFYMDVAASIQEVTEDIVLRLAATVRKETGQRNLCLAGGVALNCVVNGILGRQKIFDRIWVQPAAGDAGCALGAAYKGWHMDMHQPRHVQDDDSMQGGYLGTSFDNQEIAVCLEKYNATFSLVEDAILTKEVASLIARGKVIGWFNGRMEFGPRALGSRSILGDPRSDTMQSVMNLKVKNRESFRPFAPMVLEEHASEWFELNHESPYMLMVAPVRKEKQRMDLSDTTQLIGLNRINQCRSEIPAVTHVDYSARVQTVGKKNNPAIRRLLEDFYQQTACPILINTSFNVRGEPIVQSPDDAYICFMRTGIDVLILGNYLLLKESQPVWTETEDWKTTFQLD